jgi:hypothetical protein
MALITLAACRSRSARSLKQSNAWRGHRSRGFPAAEVVDLEAGKRVVRVSHALQIVIARVAENEAVVVVENGVSKGVAEQATDGSLNLQGQHCAQVGIHRLNLIGNLALNQVVPNPVADIDFPGGFLED